jgi:hypothetical protein
MQRSEEVVSSTEFEQRMESAYRDGTAPWETGQPCSEVERRLAAGDLPASGSALDPGCGSGVQTLLLAAHGLEVVEWIPPRPRSRQPGDARPFIRADAARASWRET